MERTQPAKQLYFTDGRTRRIRVGNTVFFIQHAPPKDIAKGSQTSVVVFQALRHVGKDAVDQQILNRIRRVLSAKDRRKLLRDARYTSDWIAEVVQQLAAEEPAEEVGNG
jgi:hypothetical protein